MRVITTIWIIDWDGVLICQMRYRAKRNSCKIIDLKLPKGTTEWCEMKKHILCVCVYFLYTNSKAAFLYDVCCFYDQLTFFCTFCTLLADTVREVTYRSFVCAKTFSDPLGICLFSQSINCVSIQIAEIIAFEAKNSFCFAQILFT